MTTNYTLAETINLMRSRGYVTTFTIQHDGIYCPELNATISPDSLTLLERHVVEAKDKQQNREVYGLRTKDNVLGIMTNTYADFDYNGFLSVFKQCRQAKQL